jgi:epsilon-lactone hydrolase
MPSNTFDQLVGLFRGSGEPVDLAAERANAAAVGALYQPVPGVTDELMAELRAGSYLMTPEEPREDLVVVLVHGGGFRSGNAAMVRLLAASLALGTRARVILPEYRLAPEPVPCRDHRLPRSLRPRRHAGAERGGDRRVRGCQPRRGRAAAAP